MKLIYRAIIALSSFTVLPSYAAYKVEVNAPLSVRSILTDHLDLVRYKNRTDLSDEQVRFMADTVGDQVKNLLATEGYFSPVTTVNTTEDNDEIASVTVSVEVGKRTEINKVDIRITGPITQENPERIATLQEEWTLPADEPFRQADWADAKSKLLTKLQTDRYAAAQIATSRASIDPDATTADLNVEYRSGPSFTLGPLEIHGLKRYPASIIHNVNPLQVGEIYTVPRLQALQRQIQNTAYFSNVIVSIDDNPEHADNTPVQVHVNEFQTQRTRLGVGYASDTGSQLESRYSHYNVFNRAWVFDAQAKVEQRRKYGSLQLAMPPDSKSYVNSISTSLDRTTLQGVDLRNFRVGLEKARAGELYDTAYSLNYYLDELSQDDGATLPDATITAPGKHRALVLGFKWARRNVDNPIFPRKGDLITLETGVAAKGLLTDQTFGRVYARYKRYMPVFTRDIIIGRAEFGGVFTKGQASEVPASLLFRAGGSDSVRGYNYQSIGNRVGSTVYPTKYLMIGSLEYQHWFTEQWGSAVFYDVGTAANSTTDREFYQGVGAGARWRSPVGTLQFDLAYGLKNKAFRPHISLGIAF
jgi:translocation and assembly module TamA